MTKSTATKLRRKGVLPPEKQKRNFTPEEALQLQEMQRLVNARHFEAIQIKANTALIPRGQEVAAEVEAIGRLLEQAKNEWVLRLLAECGYENGAKVSINLTTGEIYVATDNPKA